MRAGILLPSAEAFNGPVNIPALTLGLLKLLGVFLQENIPVFPS